MDMAKKLLIEFTWRGHKISQFIEKRLIFDDIVNNEHAIKLDDYSNDYWGEFIIGKDKYQYQIWWNSSEIAIFQYGATDYCALVDNFTLTFSNIY